MVSKNCQNETKKLLLTYASVSDRTFCAELQIPHESTSYSKGYEPMPASLGSKDVSTGVALRQRVQQRLGLLEVDSVKALGEPAIDRRQQLISCRTLALLLPQAGEAHGGAQLIRLGLLAVGDVEGLPQTDFCLSVRLHRAREQQFPLKPM